MPSRHWTTASPQDWAKAIGLVAIPLFDAKRSTREFGTHTVLLDGERSSFALSVCDMDSPSDMRQLLSWCWSSNLKFSFVVRENSRHVALLRWDSREAIYRRYTIGDEQIAREVFESIAVDSRPTAPSAVQRMIRLFRSLRKALWPGVLPQDIIQVFNALLLGSDAVRERTVSEAEWRGCSSLDDLFGLLSTKGVLRDQHAPSTSHTLHLQEFVDVFLEPDPATGCTLDTNLLLRHASGELYQEAHIELDKPLHFQATLFGIPEGHQERGQSQPDARFTAPALARLLCEFALGARKEHSAAHTPSTGVTILDPACGAGVFLVESWRELISAGHAEKIRLVGYDRSPIACEMARFALRQSIGSGAAISIDQRDSLEHTDWESADVILMNPPFVFWNNMSPGDRTNVESVLGALYKDHSDTSLAFIQNAVRLLKPGAALGCVVPAPLLESKAGLRWRQSIVDDRQLYLRLVGCFRGFNYFRGAVVEPAFLVIVRVSEEHADEIPVQVVLANDGYEDMAIRQVRRDPEGAERESPDWSVFLASQSEFPPASWLPRSRESTTRLRELAAKSLPTVTQLFKVRLGIRTGLKSAFVLSRNELTQLHFSSEQQQWFRPIAGNATIRSGRLLETQFVFFPYKNDGSLAFESEDELRDALPELYASILLPREKELKGRLSLRGRQWWELSEPRLTWQVVPTPKIVTAYFGQRGSFAFDESGRFAVVQGFGWLWRRGNFNSAALPWAYIAVLNSRLFQNILSQFCPTMRGGQYDLSVRFVHRVPLPDIMDCGITSQAMLELAEYGRLISTGEFPPLEVLDRASCRVYGLGFDEWAVGEA